MIGIHGNNFQLLLGRRMTVSLQGIVLAVKTLKWFFCEPCYTEVIKFYTEPDIIG